ncbi:hypothetical protein CGS55_10875 [Faecalibacterium prausnitzii]|uniref:Uncharacterized protein n=1 Tax=Faecalibacterium prausnitzii TaxID=853 RepID=A0A2A6ZYT2_9FIRM|nr:hypothetical protein CGS55_10875 [Faecalibacterium prausnitzii]
MVRIHPRPPRTPVSNGYRSFCFTCLEKGAARVDSNSCGAVAEDSVKTAQWAVFSSAARVIHPRPPKSLNIYNTLRFLFCDEIKLIERVDSNSIDPPNSPAGESPCATATTAASGRNREELLGLRPAGCACRPRHDAAAGSRDTGSLYSAARDICPHTYCICP